MKEDSSIRVKKNLVRYETVQRMIVKIQFLEE